MQLKHFLPLSCGLLFPCAQAQQSDASTIQTLIQEVRQLRIAIERSSTLGPRLQFTLARYQSQQDRVERLERDLRTLRAQLATESNRKEHIAGAIARLDEQARQTQDPASRKQLEFDAAGMRRELDAQSQRDQQGQIQEGEISGQLKTEQAKLAELFNQLEQLDRKMQGVDK